MKKLLCLLLLCLAPCMLSAAESRHADFTTTSNIEKALRKRAFNAPDSISQNARELTAYLVKPFDNEYLRAKVIAYWIASHIAYDNYRFDGEINRKTKRNNKNKYNILKAKIGVCEDFAKLYAQMGRIAGLKVSYVGGYVIKTDRLKKRYRIENDAVGHAWNEVKIGARTVIVDTTFMAPQNVGHDDHRKSSLKHKQTIKKREQNKTEIDTDIRTFYFDFDLQKEAKEFGQIHYAVTER